MWSEATTGPAPAPRRRSSATLTPTGSRTVGDPREVFVASATRARAVFAAPDGLTRGLELPFATLPGSAFIGLRTIDVLVHAEQPCPPDRPTVDQLAAFTSRDVASRSAAAGRPRRRHVPAVRSDGDRDAESGHQPAGHQGDRHDHEQHRE